MKSGTSSYALRAGAFYAALFLVIGVHLPYLPVWLHWRALSPSEIAIVTAAPLFIRLLVTPAVALYADHTGDHRRVVIALAWGCAALTLALAAMGGFWSILAVAVPLALGLTSMIPLIETIAVVGVRGAGLDYGRMRLWGSLSFIGIGFLGGSLIDVLGPGVTVWLMAAGAVATVAVAHALPRRPGPAASLETSSRRGLVAEDALRLLGSRTFLVFLVAAGTVQGAHAMFYTFGALHWRAQGLSTAWVGALWAIGVLAEVALFAYSGAVVRRVGPAALLIAGAAGAVLRWTAMSLDPPLAVLVPLQLLHALTYSASHLGAIHFISRAVPGGGGGTAQALYATMATGLMIGLATLASGWLYDDVGGRAYLGMAVLSGIGLVAAIGLARTWDGDSLSGASRAGPEDRRDDVGRSLIGTPDI